MTNKEIKDNLRSFNFNDQQILQLINVIKGITANETKDKIDTLTYKVQELDSFKHVPVNDRKDAKPDDILISDIAGNLMWVPKDYFNAGTEQYIKDMIDKYSYGVKIQWYYDTQDNWTHKTVVNKIGNEKLLKELPIQNNLKGVVYHYDGKIKDYLNPDDWTKPSKNGIIYDFSNTYVGVALDKDFYYKFETDTYIDEEVVEESYSKLKILISEYRIDNTWNRIERYVYSPTNSVSGNELSDKAPKNNTYGGDNNGCDLKHWMALQILYIIEFGDFNSQGVLGKGATTLLTNDWIKYNNMDRGIIPTNFQLINKIGNKTVFDKPFIIPADKIGKENDVYIYPVFYRGIHIYGDLSRIISDIYAIRHDNDSFITFYEYTGGTLLNKDNIKVLGKKIGISRISTGYIQTFNLEQSYPFLPLDVISNIKESNIKDEYSTNNIEKDIIYRITIGGDITSDNKAGMFYMRLEKRDDHLKLCGYWRCRTLN